MNECDELVGMKIVSTPDSDRFIWAICSSLSKSETARRPLTMAVAPTSSATFTSRVDTDTMRTWSEVRQALGDHLAALLEGEARVGLLGVAQGGDDDLVEDVDGPLDHLEVAVVERVEGPRDQCDRSRGVTPDTLAAASSRAYCRSGASLATSQPDGASTSRSVSITTTARGERPRGPRDVELAVGRVAEREVEVGRRRASPAARARTNDASRSSRPHGVEVGARPPRGRPGRRRRRCT